MARSLQHSSDDLEKPSQQATASSRLRPTLEQGGDYSSDTADDTRFARIRRRLDLDALKWTPGQQTAETGLGAAGDDVVTTERADLVVDCAHGLARRSLAWCYGVRL